MVRLRSEKWYAGEEQRQLGRRVATQTSGTRRIVSLCILLALVVVLMRESSNPRHVSNAFNALGVPLEGNTTGTPVSADGLTMTLERDARSTEVDSWLLTCRDLVPRMLDDLSDEQIRFLSERWFAVQTPSPDSTFVTSPPEVMDAMSMGAERIAQFIEQTHQASLTGDEQVEWIERLGRFSKEWTGILERYVSERINATVAAEEITSQPSSLDHGREVSLELEWALTEYLDMRLIQRLKDGSPWAASESVAFWRLLQRSAGIGRQYPIVNSERGPIVELTADTLSSALADYRGQSIRFSGSVRRVEHIERTHEAFGISHGYWLLWLRGSDDSAQPVAVYTLDEMTLAGASQFEGQSQEFPAFGVQALVGKGLAYASQAGVQVAPTLFASQLIRQPAAGPSELALSPAMTKELAIALGAGVLLGALLLLPLLTGFRRRPQKSLLSRSGSGSSGSSCSEEAGQVRGGAAKVLIVLAAWSVGASESTSHEPAVGLQESDMRTSSVPWGGPAQDAGPQLFKERLQSVLVAGSENELLAYVSGNQAEIPNAGLQLVQLLSRLNWRVDDLVHGELGVDNRWSVRPIELSGRVRLAMPVMLNEVQKQWFQADGRPSLIRLEMEVDVADNAESQQVSLLASAAPHMWLASARLWQPVTVQGLGLWVGGVDRASLPLCVFLQRPNWTIPKDVPSEVLAPNLPPELEELGRAGWNLAWLDMVAAHNQQPLGREEQGAFYSMMRIAEQRTHRASGRAGNGIAAEEPPRFIDAPLELLAKPRELVGYPVDLRVRLVAGTVVEVDQERSREILQGQRYYQFDGFLDLGNERVEYRTADDEEGESVVEFRGEFPVTIVMKGDSEFISKAGVPGGSSSWDVGKFARVEGLFYRLWSYESQMLMERKSTARQAAPLLIASRLNAAPPPLRGSPGSAGWFGAALCVAVVSLLFMILISVFKRDRPRRAG